MSAKHCVFCGATADITREHVFPDWLRNYDSDRSKHWRHLFGNRDRESFESMEPLFTRRPRIVCRPCNTGWMSRLETSAKDGPLGRLLDTRGPFEFSADEQRILAAWSVKTCLTLERSWHRHTPTFPVEDYRWMAEHEGQRPPPRTKVLLAHVDGRTSTWSIIGFLSKGFSLPLQEQFGDVGHGCLGTLYLVPLVLQVWTHNYPRVKAHPEPLPDDIKDYVQQVWPVVDDPLRFPQVPALNEIGGVPIFARLEHDPLA